MEKALTDLPWTNPNDVKLGQNELINIFPLNRGYSRLVENDFACVGAYHKAITTSISAVATYMFDTTYRGKTASISLSGLTTAGIEVLNSISAAVDAAKADKTLTNLSATALSTAIADTAAVFNPFTTEGSASQDSALSAANGHVSKGADAPCETWVAADGTGWYRKYNSGWIEQGGTVSFTAVENDLYTKFVKFFYVPFTTDNFWVVAAPNMKDISRKYQVVQEDPATTVGTGSAKQTVQAEYIVDSGAVAPFIDDPGTYAAPAERFRDRMLICAYYRQYKEGNGQTTLSWRACGF